MILLLLGCDPYQGWPDPETAFPWVYTPEQDLPDYAHVRVETETWIPLVDLEETGLYLQKSLYHRPGAPLEELLHFGELRPTIPPLVGSDPTLSFVGDIMMFEGDPTGFADGVADRLPGLRAGNLETPVAPGFPNVANRNELAQAYGLYAFNSRPELLDALPLDVLQLVNNHTLDLGDPGIDATLAEVEARGFAQVGLDGAAPILEERGLRVGFVAFTWGSNARFETRHDLNVVPFGHLDEPIDLSPVAADVARVRAEGAEVVVVMVHWGFEYEYHPDPHFLQLGRGLVEAGADLVVGTGPHAVEPAEICAVNRPTLAPGIGRCSVRTADGRPRTAAVLYSLGDFGTELSTLPLQVGVIATVSLRADVGVTGLGWDPVATVSASGDRKEVVPLGDLLGDEAYAAESARLDALLGTSWKRSP